MQQQAALMQPRGLRAVQCRRLAAPPAARPSHQTLLPLHHAARGAAAAALSAASSSSNGAGSPLATSTTAKAHGSRLFSSNGSSNTAKAAAGWAAPLPGPCAMLGHGRWPSQQQQRARRAPPPCAAAAGAAALGGAGDEDAGAAAPQQPVVRLPAFQPWSMGAPLLWSLMLGYLFVMLVLPIAALLGKASMIPPAVFWARATEPVAMSAYFVSFAMAIVAGLVNCVFGFILAWVLVKFEFPGKKWIDAAVDLPFALPTSVAGLTLATVYSEEGIIGALLTQLGINVVFTRLGVAVAMVFVSFPFVVRTMQPVLQEMEREVEEAAWSLGASPWETFTRVLLPPLLPPLLTGTALAFSRAIGEFGSIVIVSSNFPFKDLIAPVLIFQCLEQYDFVGATVIGTVLLMISMVMMVGVNYLQSLGQKYKTG